MKNALRFLRQHQATFNCTLWSRATAVNISRVTVNCFPFDVIVFVMMPAHGNSFVFVAVALVTVHTSPIVGHFRNTFGLFFKASPGAHLFIWKLVFICMWIKTNFPMKGWALALALKKRPKVFGKWSIFGLWLRNTEVWEVRDLEGLFSCFLVDHFQGSSKCRFSSVHFYC